MTMSDAGEYFITLTPQQAVLGVDDDCGTCANAGLERLAAAVPGVDWPRVFHDTIHTVNDRDNWGIRYWCEHCEEPE